MPLKLVLIKLPLYEDEMQSEDVILPLKEPDAYVADPEIYNDFFGFVVTFDNLPVKLDINDVFGITDDVKLYEYHLLPE